MVRNKKNPKMICLILFNYIINNYVIISLH